MGADTVVDYTQTDVLETLDDDSVDIVFDSTHRVLQTGHCRRYAPGFFIFLPEGGHLPNSTRGCDAGNYGLRTAVTTRPLADDLRAMVESGAVKGHVSKAFPSSASQMPSPSLSLVL